MVDEIPSVQDLRWPLLVLIDTGSDDDVFGLEDWVAERLGVSDEVRNAVDPETDRRFYTKRLEQALEDLYQADAIEPDEDGTSLRITDVGRRLTEPQARELPEGISSANDPAPHEEKPSVMSWIATILDSIPPH